MPIHQGVNCQVNEAHLGGQGSSKNILGRGFPRIIAHHKAPSFSCNRAEVNTPTRRSLKNSIKPVKPQPSEDAY